MAPIPPAQLTEVDQWIAAARRGAPGPARSQIYDAAGLAPLEALEAAAPMPVRQTARLSALGEDRWWCLKALSEFDCRGIESLGRWGRLLQPSLRERVARLDEADRYRLLAWLIHLSDEFDEVPIPRLAKWLHGAAIVDADRLARWPEALAGLADVPDAARHARARLVADLRTEMLRVRNDERERQRIAGTADSP